jgi:3-hydroxyisobutyrate dehydrogenase
MRLGLIGLGNMGLHFGTRLLRAGHEVVVFDLDQDPMNRLHRDGAIVAESVRDLAAQVPIVFLSLPTPEIVAKVATGADGVITETDTRIVVDLSTTGPTATRLVADRLDAVGKLLLGAPVSGGTVAAENGTLTVMAGGPRSAFDEVEPVLAAIGRSIFYLGIDPALGQTMKIINNTLCAISTLASFELLVFGTKAGLNAKTMLEIINVSSGRSFATQEKIPQCVLNRNFPMRFTTDLIHKDVKLCIEEAERMGAPLWLSPAAKQILAFAISQGDGPRDYAHVIEHFERWSNAQFGAAGPEEG